MDPMAKRVMQAFADEGFQCRAAGGWVRDQLLNKVSSDIDLAVDASPIEIQKVAAKYRWKSVPTGIEHGTMTVVFGGRHFEVTSLRQDVATDGRHAVVSFGKSFKADAERRDFTVNALYCDLNGHFYDYVGGLKDLASNMLRFVGEPERRIKEDYLRGLRFFRFIAQHEFKPDQASLAAIAAHIGGFPNLSRERITQEIKKLLTARRPDQALALMRQSGLWSIVMLTQEPKGGLPALNLAEHSSTSPAFWLARLAFLLHLSRIEKIGAKFIADWRLAKKEGELLGYFFNFLRRPPTAPDVALVELATMEALWNNGKDLENEVLALCKWNREMPQMEDWLQRYGSRRHLSMPVDGHWLQENLSVPPGPLLKTLLTVLKYSYLKGEWSRVDEAMAILRQKGAL